MQKLAGIISEAPVMMSKPEKSDIKKNLDVSSLQDFSGKPLLGHFILDVKSTPTQLFIDLAKTPDQKGKSSMEQKAFTIVYYNDNQKWDLSDSPEKPTPEDQKTLDDIVSKIK